MAEQLAITGDGVLKPVSEFTPAEKWWCDGEDCGGLYSYPHVHCMMHSHRVDIETGKSVEPEVTP